MRESIYFGIIFILSSLLLSTVFCIGLALGRYTSIELPWEEK